MSKNTESKESANSKTRQWHISLPRQNWRAKVLWFTGEFLVVVAGILVALTLNARWAEKQKHQLEKSYLSSFQTELETNRPLLEDHIGELEHRQDLFLIYMRDVIHAEPGTVSQDSIRAMLLEFGPPLTIPARRAAFDDLISGGLQLIEDAKVRRLILEYGQALELDAIRQERAEIWFDERMQAHDEMYGDLVGMWIVGGEDRFGGLDLRFEFDTEWYVGNRQFANLYMARYFREENVIAAHSTLLEILKNLLILLETM